MTSKDDGVRHFNNSEPVLLSEIIHDVLNIKYENFKTLLKFGAIYVNNDRQIKDRWIHEDSVFRVHTKPRRYNCDHDWKSLIVFHNESFLVLNKPSGIPSHPSVDNAIEDSLTQASLAMKTELFVTHRLDAMTSGLIVYAKKKQFVKDFNKQLIERSIYKRYVALIQGVQTLPAKVIHYMDPAKGTPKKLSEQAIEGWDICQLEILEQKKISEQLTWVKINLLTGRTHQIRAQMAALGAPIAGDLLYSAQVGFKDGAIALRSCEIEFGFAGRRVKFILDEEILIQNWGICPA